MKEEKLQTQLQESTVKWFKQLFIQSRKFSVFRFYLTISILDKSLNQGRLMMVFSIDLLPRSLTEVEKWNCPTLTRLTFRPIHFSTLSRATVTILNHDQRRKTCMFYHQEIKPCMYCHNEIYNLRPQSLKVTVYKLSY